MFPFLTRRHRRIARDRQTQHSPRRRGDKEKNGVRLVGTIGDPVIGMMSFIPLRPHFLRVSRFWFRLISVISVNQR